jgi:hypothetical protein
MPFKFIEVFYEIRRCSSPGGKNANPWKFMEEILEFETDSFSRRPIGNPASAGKAFSLRLTKHWVLNMNFLRHAKIEGLWLDIKDEAEVGPPFTNKETLSRVINILREGPANATRGDLLFQERFKKMAMHDLVQECLVLDRKYE